MRNSLKQMLCVTLGENGGLPVKIAHHRIFFVLIPVISVLIPHKLVELSMTYLQNVRTQES